MHKVPSIFTPFLFSLVIFQIPQFAPAHSENLGQGPLLTDLSSLEFLGLPVLAKDKELNLAYTYLNTDQLQSLANFHHRQGKCAGFEALSDDLQGLSVPEHFQNLREHIRKDQIYSEQKVHLLQINQDPQISEGLKLLDIKNLQTWVQWLSSYPDRFNRSLEPNKHIEPFRQRLSEILKSLNYPYSIDLISHKSTQQKSVRVRLEGKKRPEEIVVLGGHLDSINASWSGSKAAPGADDNASGSANLLEALRVITLLGQPERSLEFFWYAGEESGLLGSAEIAAEYKKQNADVIGVLQLDMSLFPGEGPMILGSMTDYTSSWLRDLLVELNKIYGFGTIKEGKCGYGCSDHASWYKNNYPTLMPFEAKLNSMNPLIHTDKDIIDSRADFNHSLMFSKIALAFAMTLGNSQLRQSY